MKDLYDTSPIIEYKIELFQCVASRLGKIKAREVRCDAKDEMCEKNNAQQSVTKTPKETESREEVRMFEVSTDSL